VNTNGPLTQREIGKLQSEMVIYAVWSRYFVHIK